MLLTSLFYYTVWLTVVKTLKFTLWPDLNLTVGLILVNFISNRFLTHSLLEILPKNAF